MTDSLKIEKNEDGTFSFTWDPQDPNWKWLNNMTSKEIQEIILKELKHIN